MIAEDINGFSEHESATAANVGGPGKMAYMRLKQSSYFLT